MAHPFTTFLLLFPLLLSSSLASNQITFWSQNVLNEMPQAISTKLSPLNKQDSDYYAKTISQNNFKADSNFCSVAKLSCFTLFNELVSGDKIRYNNPVASPLVSGDKIRYNNPVASPLVSGDKIRYNNPVSSPLVSGDKIRYNNPVVSPLVSGDKIRYNNPVARPLVSGDKIRYNNPVAIPLKNIDPFSFFRLSVLKEGNTMYLSNLKATLPYRAFLPPQIASQISLNPQNIAKKFPDWTKEAIETTLSYCNAAATKGEFKTCPKSLEEMISFSKTALGKNKLLSLASQSTKGSGNKLEIRNIKKFNVEKIVACHEMFLPFATYFCHSLSSSRIYSVDFVEPKTGAPVNTVVAICHLDTSSWSANHVALKILKFGPGQGEACHWMNEIDLAWIDGTGEKI
ncbi:hypothetical protein BUALT_Bualt14G0015000 [Buddleja alternifolia]|uniref:BURP domain-containing protein n=1 Tax=Buddleja alternifolia TaxID=168488 RepID=A0AAV6WR52_9LAMI|nr:hypothetical protein BUALT_Bualt14G0015000 [Buddleja alternifolia]